MPPKKELINVYEHYELCSDLSKDYMPVSVETHPHNLEVTVSFDHRRHTKATAYLAQEQIVRYLLSWHDIEEIILVIEYQKNGFPHYHINCGSLTAFPSGFTFDTCRAFNRFFGMTSCKPILDYSKWQDYLWKDVLQNNIDKPLCSHYNVYLKI